MGGTEKLEAGDGLEEDTVLEARVELVNSEPETWHPNGSQSRSHRRCLSLNRAVMR